MDLTQWFSTTPTGEFFYTILIAMIPVIELRGAIPVGVAMGLDPLTALLAAIIGNLLPIPFILLFIRHIFHWMRLHMPRLGGLVDRMEAKAHLKGQRVSRYKYLGLFIFVAIPLPGTGAWTGALVAALMDMRLRNALPAIFCGVVTAGLIVSALTYGIFSLF